MRPTLYIPQAMFPSDTTFTVFDTETTGLNPKGGDRIVEIAGVKVEGGIIDNEHAFTSLVNPECKISKEASRINKISNEDLVGAPSITEVLPQFLDFAKGSILIAHNAEFDRGFLEAEKEACWGYVEIPECLCTMKLSRSIFSAEYRHNLDVVSKRLNLSMPEARHRALPDVLLTAQVLLKLIETGKISSLDKLRECASLQTAVWR
jgi:DNA polymerase III subunit epsilon